MPADDPVRGLCPHCGEPLRGWTVGDVAVDGCDACGGCWFDGGELPAVADLEGEALAAVEDAFASGLSTFSGGGSGRCPRCAATLVERTLARSHLAVHACPSCDGIWFDEGRLQALQQTLPPDRPRRAATVSPSTARAPGPPVHCPRCGEPNDADATVCAACRRSLADPADGLPGALLSRHGFDRATIRTELQYAAWALLVALILWNPPPLSDYGRRDRIGVSPDLGLLMSIAGALALLWYARWLVKTWSIDLQAGGLTIRRLGGRRFIPWSAMRRLLLVDLPGRVHRSYFAPPPRTYPSNSDFARAMAHQFDGPPRQAWTQTPKPGDRVAAEPLRGAVWLFTDHGLVTIGPHLQNSGELYRAVREHWDGL